MANSRVGYVQEMCGSEFSFVSTNANANALFNQSLISSSLIVASPINEDFEDKGTPSLFVTDKDGIPLRLTYTMQPGYGLVVKDPGSNIMHMSVEDKTLKVNSSDELYVYAGGLIPAYTPLFVNDFNEIDLNVSYLADDHKIKAVKASVLGVNNSWQTVLTVNPGSFIDNYYIKTQQTESDAAKNGYKNQKITADLPKYIDNNTIQITTNNSGSYCFRANSRNLDPATSSYFGVMKYDNNTIKENPETHQLGVYTYNLTRINSGDSSGIINTYAMTSKNTKAYFYGDDGYLIPRTAMFPKAKNGAVADNDITNGFGVVRTDNSTIISNEGIISVHTENLTKASSSLYGIVRTDNNKTIKSDNGQIRVDTQQLDECSAKALGVCKIDDATIRKNGNGQLYVTNNGLIMSNLESLEQSISSLNKMFIQLQNDLNEFKAEVLKTAVNPFNIVETTSSDIINILNIYMPINNIMFVQSMPAGATKPVYGDGTFSTNLFGCGLTINYSGGHQFKFVSGGSTGNNYVSIDSFEIAGKKYSTNQNITTTGNSANLVINFKVDGSIKNDTKLTTSKTSSIILQAIDKDKKIVNSIVLNIRLVSGNNISPYYTINDSLTTGSAGTAGSIRDQLVPAGGSGSASAGDTLQGIVNQVAGSSNTILGTINSSVQGNKNTRTKL